MDQLANEVKGVWFVTARRYVQQHSPAALDAIIARMDAPHQGAMREPMPSVWYPEAALKQSIAAFKAVVAKGDDRAYLEAMDECMLLGINHFFRVLIRVGSPLFVLRKLAVVTQQVRRGSLAIDVAADDKRASVRYTRFPYFDDPNYRLLAVSQLRTLIHLASGHAPTVKVAAFDQTSLTLDAAYG